MKNLGLEKLFEDFYKISGMEIALVSDKFNTLLSQKCPMENFCSAVHKSNKCIEHCRASDSRIANIARNGSGVAVEKCFFGITQAIFSIGDGKTPEAYLLCSLGIDKSDINEDEIINKTIKADESLDCVVLERALKQIPKYDKETMNSYVGILTLIATKIENNVQLFAENPTLAELVRRFIDQNIAKKITLLDLSYHFHYSSVTITQSFKERFGKTIVEYVTEKRMEKAKQLLLVSNSPLSEISVLCGFSDVEYFSRSFRKYFNMPPATWRKTQKI